MDNLNVSKEDKAELLKRAKRHIFSLGVGDIGSALCRVNMKYGLAKIHWMQEELGMEPNATFISGPDETISRNTQRWQGGIGYGGKLSWGEGNEKLFVLDVMPNTCGMLVGGLNKLPRYEDLIPRIHDVLNKNIEIDGIPIEWDFGNGNHFIDLFRVRRLDGSNLPPYAFLIHSGNQELKGDNPKGSGLYYHKSKQLRETAETISTPFGDLHVLLDKEVESYWKFYLYAELFSKRRRLVAAKEIFDDFVEIANVTHQGLLNKNEVLLGVNYSLEKSLLPIGTKAGLPSFLVKGKKNLSEENVENLGFTRRSHELGVYHRLKNANIVPHGTGYTFPELLSVLEVKEIDKKRYFVVDMQNAVGQKIIDNPREIPYTFRGQAVVLRSLELGLCEIAARLIPEYVLKV